MGVPFATVSMLLSEARNDDGTVNVTVSSNKVALYVTLTTRAQGRFSDNAFFLPATSRVVQFIPHQGHLSDEEFELLKTSIRVEDHSMYVVPQNSNVDAWVL